MARTATRTSEATPQLATLPERVSVLEVKVSNIDEKIDDIKDGIGANHISLVEQLKSMRDESTAQHNELAGKIKVLESIKAKWTMYAAIAIAFLAGSGILHIDNIKTLVKFLGL